MTFSGGFNGRHLAVGPRASGTIYLPTANTAITVSTLVRNRRRWILASQLSLELTRPGTTLELDGGTLGASTPLTGTTAITNPWSSALTRSSTSPRRLPWSHHFRHPVHLADQPRQRSYTFNDPNGRSNFSGVLSGAGSVAFTPPPAATRTTIIRRQTYQSPEIAGFNTYTGGTTLNSTLVAITNRQAFGSGTLNFNWGGIDALTN